MPTGCAAIATCRCGWASWARCTATSAPACCNGLFRVRGFTQDDAHIFCTPEQIEDEVVNCLQFAIDTLNAYGFEKYEAELSTWDGGASGKYDGAPEQWALAEGALQRACDKLKIAAKVIPDEAAFYGPKIDVKLVDAIGRKWQLSTVQFDFTLPRRFGLEYIAEDGKAHQPLMVHRALYGSIERFFGILIEHYAGAFPVWLAPVQAIVLPITDRQTEYAREHPEAARRRRDPRHGGRPQREGEPQDPRSAVAEDSVHAGGGRPRAGERQVSVRNRKHADQGVKSLADFLSEIAALIDSKAVSE